MKIKRLFDLAVASRGLAAAQESAFWSTSKLSPEAVVDDNAIVAVAWWVAWYSARRHRRRVCPWVRSPRYAAEWHAQQRRLERELVLITRGIDHLYNHLVSDDRAVAADYLDERGDTWGAHIMREPLTQKPIAKHPGEMQGEIDGLPARVEPVVDRDDVKGGRV